MKKLIGRGLFSKAYQIADDRVELVSVCMSKEAIAMFAQGNKFAPIIERVDCTDNGESVYHMPLYPKVTAPKKQLNQKAYSIYMELRQFSCRSDMNYYRFVELVEGSNLDDETKENIISFAGDVSNGIDPAKMGFEISPRNITITPEGDLILLDVFFCRGAVIRARTEKEKKARRGWGY